MARLKQLFRWFLEVIIKDWGIVIFLVIVILTVFVVSAFHLEWIWTGFVRDAIKTTTTETNANGEFTTTESIIGIPGKTLWDILELLIVPLVLVVGAALFNKADRDREEERKKVESERENERKKQQEAEAADLIKENEWQTYLDRITELIEKGLLVSEENSVFQKIARVRTLTTLRRLDGVRKGMLLRFLHEAALIRKPAIVVLERADLSGADLKEAFLWNDDLTSTNLRQADLNGAKLSGTDLSNADLSGADLRGAWPPLAILRQAVLVRANLSEIDLSEIDLSNANLHGADLSKADLSWANLEGVNLEGANLTETKYNQATIWPEGFDLTHTGAILVEDILSTRDPAQQINVASR